MNNHNKDIKIASELNNKYQEYLGETILFNDDSYEILKSLKGKVKQYVVTNGTAIAQNKKLDKSGVRYLVDDIFISEYLGHEKPSIEFFNKVFDKIGLYNNEEIIIIGDLLTSDIKGGNNAGILSCWYNPHNKKKDVDVKIDYEISSLQEVYNILNIEK